MPQKEQDLKGQVLGGLKSFYNKTKKTMDQGVDEIKLKVNSLESKFKTSDEPSNN